MQISNLIDSSQRTAIINELSINLQKVVSPAKKEKRELTHRDRTRMSSVLARAFMRIDSDFDLSTSLKLAWYLIKNFEDDLQLIEFITVKGQVKQRIVYVQPWSFFNKVKGTGRPLKKGQKLFVDVSKHFLCQWSTISTYENNILEIL